MNSSKTILLAMLTVAIVIYFLAAPAANAENSDLTACDLPWARLGEPAPDFSLRGVAGIERSLADFKGKYIVLEWVNFECPLAKKHYDSNEMQAIQKTLREQGVIWLSVCSAARGAEGYNSPDDLRLLLAQQKSQAADYLNDDDGRVAQLYDIDVVPTLIMIDPNGDLFYVIAPGESLYDNEDKDSSGKDYLTLALEADKAGREPGQAAQTEYGCSVVENTVIGSKPSETLPLD